MRGGILHLLAGTAVAIALALFALAASVAAQCNEATLQPADQTSMDFSVTSIGGESLASEVVPLYGVAMVLFGTAGILSRMFPRHRQLIQLHLTQ